MKNNYIKIYLNQRNEFRTLINILLPSIKDSMFEDIDVKIDTGCPYTSIPVIKLGISEKELQKLKAVDCANDTVYKEVSFGVNDSQDKRSSDKRLLQKKEFMKLNSITFKHSDVKMSIDDMDIDITSVKLSYDRSGNILIGMDILKDWDIHIGTVNSGETIFLACPKAQLNDEYYSELNRLFGLEIK